MLLTASWREWYHFRHQQRSLANGQTFEEYVESVLALFHDDYYNPWPAGSLGDGGCDGLAESGDILYASYGTRAVQDAERKLRDKIKSDFERGVSCWDCFTKWRFVTNANAGRLALEYLTGIQRLHDEHSGRPLAIRIWRPEKLWNEVVGRLEMDQLNSVFPGAPGITHVELSDMIPLLDVLSEPANIDQAGQIMPVPVEKMDFNRLSPGTRLEFNSGRRLAPRIDQWFIDNGDPSLRDAQGDTFRKIYQAHRRVTSDPSEIIERLYVSLAGSNVRMDGKRANAAYAVTSYFFDSCHIFEDPSSEAISSKENVPA